MMPPLYRLLSVRYLVHRWDRAGLIVASIALGVATLVSTRILNRCLETAAHQSMTPLGVGDLLVSNGDLGVPRAVADDLKAANIPGVKTVQPLVVDKVFLTGLDNRPAVLIGAELASQFSADGNPLGVRFTETIEKDWATARLAVTRRLIVLSKPVYDDWVARRADKSAPFVVRYATRTVDCLPVGYIEFDDASPVGALGRTVIGMELGQAARFLFPGPPAAAAAVVGATASEPVWDQIAPPKVHRVDVMLQPGADVNQLEPAVARVVGDRATVRTPEAHNQTTQEIVSGLQIGFTLCSAGAMVVGLFLVYNALAVTVAERRHDIGILRSLGATRPQVVALFAIAAVLLGLVGSAVGVPLGVGMARVVIEQFREELGNLFYAGQATAFWPTPLTVALAVLAGVGTAVLAALIPSVQAATQDPADAVRRVPGVAGGVWKLAHQATCGALIAGGVAMVLTRHDLPPRVGAFGGMMTALIGLLLAAPLIVGLMVRLTHPLLRRVLPIEARLAADNLLRSPGRTGVVIGALGAGVAVMIQTAGVGMSNEQPVVRWIDEIIQADRMVFSGSLSEAIASAAPVDARVPRELALLPGVEGVFGVRYRTPDYNGTKIFLTALDAGEYVRLTGPRLADGLQAYANIGQLAGSDGTVVSENFARRHRVDVGEVVELPGPKGAVRLRVLATIPDYSWSRGTVFLDRQAYRRLFADDQVDVAHVFLGDPAAAAEVERYAAANGLSAQDRSSMRSYVADLIDRVYLLAYVQQVIVGLVASLGVVTALLISVLQRKRELGLLLAVGATPAQVVRSVVWEAILMGAFGTALGVLIGLPLEWYVLKVVLVDESGFVFDLLIPWRQGVGIAVGAVAVATAAGLLPALHAVRMRVTDAIAYE
jgi:putative ABC transport system permease protein